MFIVPPAIQRSRLDQCRECKFSKDTPGVGLTCGTFLIGGRAEAEKVTHYRKKVRLCGCKMTWKTKYSFAKCPIGRWDTHNLDDVQIKLLETFVQSLEGKATLQADQVQQLFKWKSKISGRYEAPQYCGSCVKELLSEIKLAIEKMKQYNP